MASVTRIAMCLETAENGDPLAPARARFAAVQNGVLAAAAAGPFRHVVVQPHLLFRGELLKRVRAEVESAARSTPKKTWRVAGHLGASPLLAEAAARIIVNRLSDTP